MRRRTRVGSKATTPFFFLLPFLPPRRLGQERRGLVAQEARAPSARAAEPDACRSDAGFVLYPCMEPSRCAGSRHKPGRIEEKSDARRRAGASRRKGGVGAWGWGSTAWMRAGAGGGTNRGALGSRARATRLAQRARCYLCATGFASRYRLSFCCIDALGGASSVRAAR